MKFITKPYKAMSGNEEISPIFSMTRYFLRDREKEPQPRKTVTTVMGLGPVLISDLFMLPAQVLEIVFPLHKDKRDRILNEKEILEKLEEKEIEL